MMLTKEANLRAISLLILLFFVQGTELHGQDRGDSLITLLEEEAFEDDTGKVELLNDIGRTLYKQDPDSAALYIKRAYDLAKRVGHEKRIEESLNLIGIVHYVKSEYKEASEHWEKLLERRKKRADTIGISKVQNNLGLLYYKLGRYKDALQAHQNVLSIREKHQKKKTVGQSLNNLGMIHYELGNLEKAQDHYSRALKIYREEGMKENIGGGYNNLGLVLRKKGEYDRALKLAKRALRADRKAGRPRLMGNDNLAIGMAFKEKSEPDSALRYFQKARSIYKKFGNQDGVATALSNIAGIHLEMGDSERALGLALKAFRKADSLPSQIKKKGAANYIAQASAALEDSGMAFRFQKIHDELSDSILDQEKSKQLAGIEVKYESEKRKRELEREKAKRRKTELKWQRGLFITGGGGGLLLLVIVFLILRYRQKKLANQWLEEQKEALRKEKETKEVLLKEVNHRVKNNLQLITSLLSLQGKRIEDEELRGLHRDSQNRIHSMGLLHEKIHRTEKWDGEDLERFLEDLAERLKETFGMSSELVTVFEVDASELDRESITPLALILNELLSNAMKYAFKGRDEGRIKVEIVPEGDHYRLEVRDDGNGIDDLKGDEEGLGLEIVRSLAEQLGGNLEILEREKGTSFRIRFPKRT